MFTKTIGKSPEEFNGPSGLHQPVSLWGRYFLKTDDMGEDARRAWQENYHALASLFCRPWLGRVWVLQEVQNAKEVGVYCSRHFAYWSYLMLSHYWHSTVGFEQHLDETEYVSGMTNAVEKPWRSLPVIWEMVSKSGRDNPLSLYNLVLHVRDMQATDPHDFLYALRGMAKETRDDPKAIWRS